MAERIIYRYSLAFKQKVISAIESGELSIEEARRIYGIRGKTTVQKWLKRVGKYDSLYKVVRIEMKGERDKLKELEKQKKQLESALAQEHLKNICLEALIDSIEKHYGIDAKKNFGEKASQKFTYKGKNKN
jgi:transposase-like protein